MKLTDLPEHFHHLVPSTISRARLIGSPAVIRCPKDIPDSIPECFIFLCIYLFKKEQYLQPLNLQIYKEKHADNLLPNCLLWKPAPRSSCSGQSVKRQQYDSQTFVLTLPLLPKSHFHYKKARGWGLGVTLQQILFQLAIQRKHTAQASNKLNLSKLKCVIPVHLHHYKQGSEISDLEVDSSSSWWKRGAIPGLGFQDLITNTVVILCRGAVLLLACHLLQ